MNSSNKRSVSQVPDLKSIFVKVKKLAAQSASAAAATGDVAVPSQSWKLSREGQDGCPQAVGGGTKVAKAVEHSADNGSVSCSDSAVTITFGDCAENHAGMQKLGETMAAGCGFSVDELHQAARTFEAAGAKCELIDLVAAAELDPSSAAAAAVLVIRNGANVSSPSSGADALLFEQLQLQWDTRALMRGRVVNKRARHNVCYGEVAQEPHYEAGKGRVVPYSAVPHLRSLRQSLPQFFGPKAHALYAEGNLYYDISCCGIGFHGDSERRKVVAVRLGAAFPLQFQWFLRSAPMGKRVNVDLHHGDMYCMSEKAVGTDWMTKVRPTLRHAAGCAKFLTVSK